MALEERKSLDKIEVVGLSSEWCHVQVRMRNEILKDGKVIASSFEREVYTPIHDVNTIADAEVKAVCTQHLTAKRKAAYIKANPLPELPKE